MRERLSRRTSPRCAVSPASGRGLEGGDAGPSLFELGLSIVERGAKFPAQGVGRPRREALRRIGQGGPGGCLQGSGRRASEQDGGGQVDRPRSSAAGDSATGWGQGTGTWVSCVEGGGHGGCLQPSV